jgi:VCBS repeat-containing protein
MQLLLVTQGLLEPFANTTIPTTRPSVLPPQVSNCTVDIGAVQTQWPNSPPTVADPPSFAAQEDTPLLVDAPRGVLSGTSDPDCNAALAAALVSGPSHGSLNLKGDGSFTYTPDANYNGPDSFTFRVSDGQVASAVATARITVREWLLKGSHAEGIRGMVTRAASAHACMGATYCIWLATCVACTCDTPSKGVLGAG